MKRRLILGVVLSSLVAGFGLIAARGVLAAEENAARGDRTPAQTVERRLVLLDILDRCGREHPVPGLVLLLKDREIDADTRAGVVHLLSDEHGGPWSVNPLIEALRTDKETKVRAKAAQELAFLTYEDRASEIMALLIATLRDRSEEVREEALRALVRIGDSAVVEALKPLVEDREVGPYALEALDDIKRYGKPSAAPVEPK